MFFSLNRKQIKRAMILVAGNEGAFKDSYAVCSHLDAMIAQAVPA